MFEYRKDVRKLLFLSLLMFMNKHLCNANVTVSDEKNISLSTLKDIEKLAKLVLMRGHIIIDPKQEIKVNKTSIEHLLDFIYASQRKHFPNGRRSFPAMEERNLACYSMKNTRSKALCQIASSACLPVKNMIAATPTVSFHQLLTKVCPMILFRYAKPFCLLYKSVEITAKSKLKLIEPSSKKVWGFGVLFVTLSIVVSMGGLILLPFLKRERRRTVLTLFEGLAVGGLIGTAILHLFPQAFNIEDEKFITYFWQTFLIFLGVYVFYITERILRIISSIRGKGKRRRTPSFREEETAAQKAFNSINNLRDINKIEKSTKQQQHKSPRQQLRSCLAVINSRPYNNNQEGFSEMISMENEVRKQYFVHDVAGRRKDQNNQNLLNIDSVAWMIVLGDASLNFIDGLSIGATFDRNILAGISVSVAVMLEEVTHRLGTFAVLIRAGMHMKQSFIWIFMSACALYPGLVLGIILGDEAEDASPYIFALAGGMFVYMALVDVMKEMNRSLENATRKSIKNALRMLALQNLGIFIAITFLAFLALHEDKLNFEAVELKELTDHSLQ